MIKIFSDEDLQACCELYLKVFNSPPWNDTWTKETAFRCLSDLAEHKRFVGYTLWENEALIGAVFAHTKTFYKGDEIYIDELFISPDCQRRGHGLELMGAIEKFAAENSLSSITLLTAVKMPAFDFYEKQGYLHLEHMAFMYKKTECL